MAQTSQIPLFGFNPNPAAAGVAQPQAFGAGAAMPRLSGAGGLDFQGMGGANMLSSMAEQQQQMTMMIQMLLQLLMKLMMNGGQQGAAGATDPMSGLGGAGSGSDGGMGGGDNNVGSGGGGGGGYGDPGVSNGGGGGGGGGSVGSSGGAGGGGYTGPVPDSGPVAPGTAALLKDAGDMVGLNENSDTARIMQVTGESGINPSTTPWCAAFAINMMKDHGVLDTEGLSNPNYCPTIKSWAQGKENWGENGQYTPKAGDAILFDWEGDGTSDHIGIVESVKDGKVYTIEGNSSDSVKRNVYNLGDSNIDGYVVSHDTTKAPDAPADKPGAAETNKAAAPKPAASAASKAPTADKATAPKPAPKDTPTAAPKTPAPKEAPKPPAPKAEAKSVAPPPSSTSTKK